jgi:hypothetical protein
MNTRRAAIRAANDICGHVPEPPSHAATADRNAPSACSPLICGIVPISIRASARRSAGGVPRGHASAARTDAAQHPSTAARGVPGGAARGTPSRKTRPATKGAEGATGGGVGETALSDARANLFSSK